MYAGTTSKCSNVREHDAEDEMIVQVMRQKQRKECVHMMTKVPRDIRIMPDVRIVMMG